MNTFQKFFTVALFLMTAMVYSQTTVSGTVVDASGPVPGANVLEKGTSNGTSTDFDGKFSIQVQEGKGVLEISFVGMVTTEFAFTAAEGQNIDAGTITLSNDNNVLEEVILTGTIDIAKSRETPVAVSTIRAIDIQENLGTQELPEILNLTPSVYATKQGGGFGDSRINIRGFDQRNTAVMINGQPVNDMENGWVYWSNWAGLSDVTTAMQVQRGLGSSKLAISSVGGTINVITRTSTAREGGTVATTFGNDNYTKVQGSYSTGLLESGFSASILISHTQGDGYVDGTKFEGNNYFIGLGYKFNDAHDLQFIFTGAPQWHHQKSFAPSIADHQLYQKNGPDPDATTPNRKYNGDWGYFDGKEYSFRRNFYHKPVMSLNWEWVINDKMRLSTVVYGSWGRGGGTGEIGRINGRRQFQLKTPSGLIPVDDIFNWNSGGSVPSFGDDRTKFDNAYSNTGNNGHPDGGGRNGSDNGISRRASMNSHNWYGGIINFHDDINENWSFDVGADLRTYKGIHYRVVNDVLGADNYIDYDNQNNRPNKIEPDQFVEASPSWNPWDNIQDQEKIDYYNDGLVNWQGLFGQLEYKNDKISAFVQASFSNQGFQRVEYFNEPPESQKSEKQNQTGGNIKGGLNYNINENHNIFGNAGYYSKQPLFDAVFINFSNTINPDLVNEKIIGLEFGYGYTSPKFSLNANFYRTEWADRFESSSVQIGDFRGVANYQGIKQVHMGMEVDFLWRVLDNLRINGMASFGNWEYQGDAEADIFDESQNYVGSSTLYLDGVKVGDAAQVTAALGASYTFFRNFKAGLNWRLASSLYADIDVTDFVDEDNDGSLELPSFNLMDARLSYNWQLKGKNSLEFSVNVNNLFDTLYISESETNRFAEDGDDTWKGINTRNRVFFGWGRTWNTAVRFRF
ncbi:TonB-dependent receptor [Lutimonas zeaxanthinifaciens]|uniref:TonB-dependent receptor n=1 Tax=Lutimonas zeaxanthinifaciens TaxID=3060215 RepID=UPI00265D227E|nr:TonB-dependent receptor [Lutimonas sp. YSD2104]WKK65986.1 TonB-dependent receptor [Lutimonas sp. YSD2104]